MPTRMIKFMQIEGESLSPDFQDGDFVLITNSHHSTRRVKPGDVIAFEHPAYGMLIKRVTGFDEEGLLVAGSHPDSLDSRKLGSIHPERVLGKVIWHVRKRTIS